MSSNMNQKGNQKKIGLYSVGELIGKGAMGCVYKGMHTETGTIVAIKQVAIQNLKCDQLNNIQQEISLLKRLNHENIVKYIDYIQTESHLNIVMEFVESSLASIIKKFGSYAESLVINYIKQVLTGLDYLHCQGVVHRDIKGANILTTKDSKIKLADFGVATRVTEDEKAQSFVGTPYYMAPELIEMRGIVSSACDIWSLGCTVIELITGQPPYHDLYQFPAMFRIVQDDHPPLPQGVSQACINFLLLCFQKDPVKRSDAKTLLKHEWITNLIPDQMNIEDLDSPQELTSKRSQEFLKLKINATPDESLQQSSKKSQKNNLFIDEFQNLEKDYYEIQDNDINIHNNKNKVSANELIFNSRAQYSLQINYKQSTRLKKDILIYCEQIQNYQNYQIEEIIQCICQITKLVKEQSKYKFYILKNCGLSILTEILDEYSNSKIGFELILCILQLLNQMIDQDSKLLENTVQFGILPYILNYSQSEYPKEIRVESAYFIGQMFFSTQSSLNILIAAGGIQAICEMLDFDFQQNKNLVFFALNFIQILFELKLIQTLNLCKILLKYNILHRLIIILDEINQDLDESIMEQLNKTLMILTYFSNQEDKRIKSQLCKNEIISQLLKFLSFYQKMPEQLSQVIQIIHQIVNEPSVINILENSGLIPKVVEFLQMKLPEKSIQELLKISFLLGKLSPARQEQFIFNGALEILIKLSQKQEFSGLALALVAQCLQTSSITREKVWEYGGPDIFLNRYQEIHQNYKLLDALSIWMEFDKSKFEIYFEMGVEKLIRILNLSNKQEFQLLIPIYLKLILNLEILAEQLVKSDDFIKELLTRLAINNYIDPPSAIARKEILEILLIICVKSQMTQSLMVKHNLKEIVLKIQQIARQQKMVILEEISQRLLDVFQK